MSCLSKLYKLKILIILESITFGKQSLFCFKIAGTYLSYMQQLRAKKSIILYFTRLTVVRYESKWFTFTEQFLSLI